jgi:hypothetical protein
MFLIKIIFNKTYTMKKVLIILTFIFVLAPFCKSQFFIGGNIGFNAHGGKTENNDNSTKSESSFRYNLNPQFGFRVAEKMDIGAYLTYGHDHTNDNYDPATISNELSLGFRPFMRYYAFIHNKFSIYGEFAGVYNYSVEKMKTGDTEFDDTKTVTLGFLAYPGMSYKLSEKFELMAGIDLFSLGITHNMQKTGDNKDSNTAFHLGVNMDHILTTGSVSVGAIFRF